MRDNQPVTQNEFVIGEHQYLISRTDLKGRITYANPAFVEVSGYSREELLGSPHNIVRHPDMPPEAFGDLWETVKRGDTWTGLVKNRRKNGDFYWVLATVTPTMDNGAVVGYTSVRVRPAAGATAQAEALKVQNAALAQNRDVLELRRIEVERVKAEKWNGQLPTAIYAGAPIPFFNPQAPTSGK